MDIFNIKSEFPIFNENPNLIYLDSASTSQKPKTVINSISRFYSTINSNVGRGATRANDAFWRAYKTIKEYINGIGGEILFTKNSTEALNMIYQIFEEKEILNGKKYILTSDIEHHSNLLPLERLAQKHNLRVIKIKTIDGKVDTNELISFVKEYHKDIAFISLSLMSNISGGLIAYNQISDLKKIYDIPLVYDATQAIAHSEIDIEKLLCDCLVFSAHKVYGPLGVGVMYISNKLLEDLKPILLGGGMVDLVTDSKVVYAEGIKKYIAGTPDIVGVIATADALLWFKTYIQNIGGWEIYTKKEQSYISFLNKEISNWDGITLVSSSDSKGIFTFYDTKLHPHDAVYMLDLKHIMVRGGMHCVGPWHTNNNLQNGSIRISFGVYTTKDDIQSFLNEYSNIRKKI